MNKPTAIKRYIFLIVFMVIGFVLTFCQFEVPFTNYVYNGFANSIKLGLDLKGGVLAVYQAEDDGEPNFDSRLNATVSRLQSILTSEGYSEAVVSIQQGRNIRVEVPDVDDPEAIFELIGEPATLEFRATEDGEAVLTGEHITDVYASYQQGSEGFEYGVVVNFNAEGSQLFYNLTSENVGGTIYIYSNDQIISAPTVNSAIAGGSTFISGSSTYEDAEAFALQIMSGTFSVDLTLVENSVISATLGVDALRLGLIAGIIGIILMFIYMAWRYRVMGWIANFALCFYIILFMFFLQAIPIVQLTLEGIAGIILSIGMAIDANIIIFERIKEEYAYGKRIEPSINAGFKRALPAILDSNITTILAAVILLIFGTGSIQGFAMTLLIGIVLSMFSSIVITRGLLKMYYPINSTNAKKYSLKREVASDVQK